MLGDARTAGHIVIFVSVAGCLGYDVLVNLLLCFGRKIGFQLLVV
ncbi:hypothetical protein [uncultured Gammaproteobacteria bacterium]|nr:hypothetical protein [uncultured Gammaproteobacteria bacterium]